DSIDIKPGVFPNNVHPGANGKIEVAILGTASFNATNVNPMSVRFGHSGTEAPALSWTLTDVDGDGDVDMVLKFKISSTGILCGDTSARLTGMTLGGRPINAVDSINTVGCP